MAGKYLRGAFVSFSETFPIPVPNVIIFQYNPGTMTHSWTPAATGGAASTGSTGSAAGGPDANSNPLAVTGPPGESFAFTLMLDANDQIADANAVSAALATASGVYTRMAALEMLMFPVSSAGGGLIGTISSALGLSGGGSDPSTAIPAQTLPMTLFIWGPGRIVPVRMTSMTETEKLYENILLNPTHVEIAIGCRVLTTQDGTGGVVTDTGLAPLGDHDLPAFAGQTVSAILTTGGDDAGTLTARATAMLREAGWFVTARGTADVARLGSILRAGSIVALAAAGAVHSGKYLVWSVRHKITAEAHKMDFTLVRNAAGSPP